MSKQFRLVECLERILEAIDRLKAGTAGLSEEEFMRDTGPQDIATRNIEVIGEAGHSIILRHPEFAAQHPELELKDAYDMRNLLTHGHLRITPHRVWTTVQESIPVLQKQVQDLLQTLPND